jgi:Serine carboxypeptidase S28
MEEQRRQNQARNKSFQQAPQMRMTKPSKGLLFFLAMVSWTKVAEAGMANHQRLVDVRNRRHFSSLHSIGGAADDYEYDTDEDVQELFLTQRLNHFAPSQGHTFEQRYFYSDRHVNDAMTMQYAFLCVGGEGPSLTYRVLVDSVHCSGDMLQVAAKFHSLYGLSIHLFALEHRYYGNSFPSK